MKSKAPHQFVTIPNPLSHVPNAIKRLPWLVLGWILTLHPCFGDDADSIRPHVVYINADDLGVQDVGFNDNAFRTPNLDRLATQGMTFTNAYAPAANCSPSRACVLSGLWTPRHGVYTVGQSDRGKSKDRKLIPTKNTQFLASKVVTLAETLKSAGYRTIHLGKYHIGRDPLANGFDENVGGDQNGSPAGGYYSPWNKGEMARWSSTVPDPSHRIDVFVREAQRFLKENHSRGPMFVHFSPYLVHSPLTAVPEYVAGYEDRGIDPRYGSMVEKFDQAVGKLLETLERLKIAKRTIVIFSSDNGGIAAIHSQSPYRGGKGSYYDGGIREPMLVRWPGVVEPGSRCEEIVNTLDLYPTLVEVAEIDVGEIEVGEIDGAEPVRLDGVSLVPLLRGTDEWQPVTQYWHFPVYLQKYAGKKDDARDALFRTRPGSAMRDGRWKLHEYFEDGAIELYDLESDPGERQNLVAEKPDVAQRLHQKLRAWRERTAAPVPTELNPEYEPAR